MSERFGMRDERGGGSVLMLLAVLVAVVAAGVMAVGANWVAAAHRAAAAADMAALAGADAFAAGSSGEAACRAAGRVAADNGARLASCKVEGGVASFVVRVTAEADLRPRLPAAPTTVSRAAHAGNV